MDLIGISQEELTAAWAEHLGGNKEIGEAMRQTMEQAFRHQIARIAGSEQAQWCGYGQHWTKGVYRRRQNTRYNDEESNWITCCGECFGEVEESWAEQWEDYYSMVL